MILVQVQGFFIKYDSPYFIAGQFNTLDSKIKHTDLLSAVRDIHSRLIIGFYEKSSLKGMKAALEKSDVIIQESIKNLPELYLSTKDG